MQAQIKLGRIFGIEIGLHYSWLIIALLVTLSLAGHFQMMNSNWGAGTIWATAVVTGLLFFAAIVLHELSHAAVAKARGLPVRAITLFALGGVAQIDKDAEDAKTEFWMGIVGPITSAVIGFGCLALAYALGWAPEKGMMRASTPLMALLVWLGYISIALAIFNMIPGFPLDGGRVLRAIVWWATGDANRSTRIAAKVGQLVAFAFIIWGIFRFFGGAGIGGLWIAFIGWFLLQAAGASYATTELTMGLKGARVGDIMTRDCPVVEGNSNLQHFVEEFLLRSGKRCFVVEQHGELVGLITPHDIKAVERQRWPYTTVSDVMRPLDQVHTVTASTPVAEALETMGRDDVNQLPVVSGNRLEGVITRANVLQFLQTRAELTR